MTEAQLPITILVTADKRDLYEVFLPFLTSRSFRGPSLAELMDDAALFLMESVPSSSPGDVHELQFSPHVITRKVRVAVELKVAGSAKKRTERWSGRLLVVLRRWPDEPFYEATIPQLGVRRFAVGGTAGLNLSVEHYLQSTLKDYPHPAALLDGACARKDSYLDLLRVDTEYPSILPSRKRPRRSKKRGRARTKARIVVPEELRQVGTNLLHRAQDHRLPAAFCRDELVTRVALALEHPGAAVLLVGPSGVGKSAIIYEAIRREACKSLPLTQRTDFWEVTGNRMISGMTYVGDWEHRTEKVIHELTERDDVLVVPDLAELVFAGNAGASKRNVAGFMEPHLAQHDFRIVGECTPNRLEAARNVEPNFVSRFHIIRIEELSESDTATVLVNKAREIEATEPLMATPEALDSVLSLTRRFLSQQANPGKAVFLLDQVFGNHKRERDSGAVVEVSRESVIRHFSAHTGLPRFVLWEEDARTYKTILRHFEHRIIAQPEASRVAAQTVARLQQGLQDPERPLLTALFVGPTGVGKTETAKALAEFLFGSASRLCRFDMSEFQGPYSVARLIGDRQQPQGELTRKVSQQPFSVVLFDEIEKAHPSVFDTLLQLLGEGRLTNAAGRTTDFCNTIVLMTSNLGVAESQHNLGFGPGDSSSRALHFRRAAEMFFRPEFFNRIDRVVPFDFLGRDAIAPLVQRTLTDILGRRGLRRSGVVVDVEPQLVELLVDRGFDKKYGARSMRRALEQELTVPLAEQLVLQQLDATSVVSLFQVGEGIGIEVWGLEEAPTTSPDQLPQLGSSWTDLVDRSKNIVAVLDRLMTSPDMHALRELRVDLVQRGNMSELGSEAWLKIQTTSFILDQLPPLEERGEQLLQLLEPWAFELGYDTLRWHRPGYGDAWQYQVVFEEKPVAIDRGRAQKEGLAQLLNLEVDVTRLEALVASAATLEPEVLLRILPVTADVDTLDWAEKLHHFYYLLADEVLGARVQAFDRVDSWRLLKWGEPVRRDAPREDGYALLIEGIGLSCLVREVGLHVNRFSRGPDAIHSIARVEVVDRGANSASLPGDASSSDRFGDVDSADSSDRAAGSVLGPCGVLDALDRDWAAFCDERRAGATELPNPRPPLPIRRRSEAIEVVDPRTGVSLSIPRPPSRRWQPLVRQALARHVAVDAWLAARGR